MPTPLSQRLFGLTTEDPDTVATLVERLQRQTPEGHGRVIVAQTNDSVADAYELFGRFNLHHLPVVSGTKVVGIVSSTDLLEFFASAPLMDAADVPLQDVMTKNPHVVMKDTTIREVIRVLAHSTFRCVPVVTDAGDIWDILTTRDLVRLLELEYAD